MNEQPTMTQPSLSHAHAVVTGAQQGIGLAIAVALAQAGAHIVANYLDEDAAASGMRTLSKLGARVTWVKADLTDTTQIAHLFAQADAQGGVDILVNNAAIFPRADFLDLTEAMWDQTLAVNLKAPFLCTQQAARRMIAGRRSAISRTPRQPPAASPPRGCAAATGNSSASTASARTTPTSSSSTISGKT